jgi:hypothetical protein
MVWQTVRRTAVVAAFLAGTSLIACAQGSSTAGAAGTIAGADPNSTIAETAGGSPATAKSPGNSGPQGPGGSSTGGGSLPPCSSGPPYTSLPCQ